VGGVVMKLYLFFGYWFCNCCQGVQTGLDHMCCVQKSFQIQKIVLWLRWCIWHPGNENAAAFIALQLCWSENLWLGFKFSGWAEKP
jgi:hypothetical protein